MPLGPNDDRRILAIALAALMWALCASIPLIRCFFSCSYAMNTFSSILKLQQDLH
jgi:hypothetical protein